MRWQPVTCRTADGGRRHAAVVAAVVGTVATSVAVTLTVGSADPLLAAAGLFALLPRHTGGPRLAAAAVLIATPVLVVATTMGGVWHAALALAALAVSFAVGRMWRLDAERLAEEARRQQGRAERLGMLDEVTGTLNRHGLTVLGAQVLQEVRRRGDAAHALFVTVDGGTAVRASRRAEADEEVICAVADALRVSIRATDALARWSADTFVVVGPGSGIVPGELERRTRAQLLDGPRVAPGVWPCRLTAGMGVLEPWAGGDLGDLLARAEEDLSLRRALRAPSAPEPPAANLR